MPTLLDFTDEKIKVPAVKGRGSKSMEAYFIEIPANMLSKLPKDDYGRIYTKEYVLDLIENERYIFDVRHWWKKGLTEEIVKECFESGKWETNAGHFDYVVRGFKVQGGTFEELWKAFEENREQHWRAFVTGAEEEIKKWKELLGDHNDPTWLSYYNERIQEAEEEVRFYQKVLEGHGFEKV